MRIARENSILTTVRERQIRELQKGDPQHDTGEGTLEAAITPCCRKEHF